MGPGPCFSSPKLGQLLRNATSAAIKLLVLVGACALWPEGVWCSEASCHSSGCKSRQQRSPVAVVVISSNGEGDRSVESLEVKAPGGWAFQSDPYRGASNLAGRSGSEPVKPRNLPPARNGLRECRECRAGGHSVKAMSASKFWILMSGAPGSERAACQEGMSSE